jgi:RNA polymerase sigma-70 factor (ECF subfamily)
LPDDADRTEDDADVIALLRDGAHAVAFDRIAERYAPRIFRLCHAFVRDEAAAEDLAQETLVRVWRALASFDARSRLSTWIYAIARNRCLTAIARRRTTEPLTDDQADETPGGVGPEAAADDGASRLRGFVGELPERQRLALTLYYYEERSVAEVATVLGIPEATVKTHLARGRAQLLDRLQAAGLGDSTLWIDSTR